MSSSPMARPPMPIQGWTEHKNAQGRVYWYNQAEKRSVWEKPTELKTARERALSQTQWKEYQSGERKYYVNSVTKESSWTLPKELKNLFDSIPDESSVNGSASPYGGSSVRPQQRQMYSGPPPGFQSPDHSTNGSNSPMPPSASRSPVIHMPPTGPSQQQPYRGPQSHHSAQAAPVAGGEEAFIQLLREKGVDASWTWEQTMRQIITEPLYKALATLAERKAVFSKYVRMKEEEVEKAKKQKAKEIEPLARESIKDKIANGRIVAWLSYEGMLQRCSSKSAWKKLESIGLKEAKEAWESIRKELREEERKRKKDLRERNRKVFMQLLHSFEADVLTRWKDARQTVLESDEWKADEKLRQIDLVDMIEVFDELIQSIEKQKTQEMKQAHVTQKRQDRQRREWFCKLLQEGKKDGWITARSTFGEVYDRIKSESQLQEMLGQPGSTPLDFFFDVLDDLQRELDLLTDTVIDALQNHPNAPYQVSESTTLNELKEAIRLSVEKAKDSKFNEIESRPDDELKLVLDELIRKVQDEKRRVERKLRHLGEDLRYALKKYAHHHSNALGGEDESELDKAWSEWKPILADLKLNEWDAYNRTPFKLEEDQIDEARRSAWERFVERQKEKLSERRKVQDQDGSHSSGRKRKSEGESSMSPVKSREASRKERRAGEKDSTTRERERHERRSGYIDEPSAAKKAKHQGGAAEEDSEEEEGEV
ncbi:uncharacterized protein FA14DRAFT_160344 [Meira miltonrushii]|uniref:WW domain-containing protein n=1 Tax=Meira miltonrushii TaxID=1280837 RepID=A0A316VBF0_9BASI|nr:uncharacterized protein FA14DRAFT_160344 [Meira miltonrushii]PWN34969.1 hypothetical protein FA14DRAFT_160344 [Meira miltonrushii]